MYDDADAAEARAAFQAAEDIVGHPLPGSVMKGGSLKKLRVDCIDLFYLHKWDFRTGVDEVMRGLDDLVRAGKIHYAAISDTPAWQIARMQTIADLRGWSPFVALQIAIVLASVSVVTRLNIMAYGAGVMGAGAAIYGVLAALHVGRPTCTVSSAYSRLTKNYDNNNDVIGLMSGKIPCGPYLKPQSFIGFVYKEKGVGYMCRISVPAEAGLFIGQISVGWKEQPSDVEVAQTIMTVSSGLLFGKRMNTD